MLPKLLDEKGKKKAQEQQKVLPEVSTPSPWLVLLLFHVRSKFCVNQVKWYQFIPNQVTSDP